MHEIHYRPGRFVWHELVTPDVEAARRFYGELVGWQIDTPARDASQPYAYLTKNGQRVGGVVLRPGPHVPPHVLGFVSVLDVEGTLDRARERRGALLVPPMQTQFGRAAVVQDPQGASLGVCRAADGDAAESRRSEVGTFAWDQLNTSDAETACRFYTNVFAWQREPVPSKRDLSAFTHGGKPLAGLLQAPQGTFAQWLAYLSVERLERARVLVKQLGGAVMVESVELAGTGQACVIQDNVGTILALFEAHG
jgi:predicted enzyme related to lactoylglutathione lyase